jgi:hypothetical protein
VVREGRGALKLIKTGAPTKYIDEYPVQARELCENGATLVELAAFFQVSTFTIHQWRNRYPAFASAIKVGREASDNRVERALYERATGYSIETVKLFRDGPKYDETGCRTEDGKVTRVVVTEHIPPDTTACIFWLKNRRPREWRDKHDLNVNGTVNFDHRLVPSDIAALAAGDLDELQRKYSETLDLVAEVQQIPAASDDRAREEPA